MSSQTDKPQYSARWYNRAGIWIGIGVNPAAITLGGNLATRLETPTLTWVVPIGAFFLWLACFLAGLIGRRRRFTFVNWSTATFGTGIGAILMNLTMALGLTGWSGFQMGLGGTSFANLLGINQATWIGVVGMGILVIVMGNLEINKWNWFVWLTTLSSLAMAVIATIIALQLDASVPLDPRPVSFHIIIASITSIITYALLFALRSTDFTWDLVSDRDVLIDATIFITAFLISVVIGVMLFQSTGSPDLAVVLSGTPLALMGKAFLFVSLLSPALSSMLSGGLAWAAVLKTNYRVATVLLVGAGTLLGLVRFDQELLSFLDWLAAILPAAVVIMLVYGLAKREFSTKATLAGWMAGAAIAIIIKLLGGTFHFAIGMGVGLIVLSVANQFFQTKNVASQG